MNIFLLYACAVYYDLGNDPAHNEPVVKPNVRKHPIMRQGGRLVPTKGDPRGAEIHLTEYSAWLPRCLRLRKKVTNKILLVIQNILDLLSFPCWPHYWECSYFVRLHRSR